MNISAKAVRFDDVAMWVELHDGRTIGIPLAGRGDMTVRRPAAA